MHPVAKYANTLLNLAWNQILVVRVPAMLMQHQIMIPMMTRGKGMIGCPPPG